MASKNVYKFSSLIFLAFFTYPFTALASNPALKTGMDIMQPQNLEVNGVKIENFSGKVVIKSVGSNKNVKISLKGDTELLKQVKVGEDQGNLRIGFEKDAPVVKDIDSLTLNVEMPATLPLELELVGGKAVIGERETEDTRLTLNGFGDIHVASVKNLESIINGSGEITIDKISGTARLTIRGDGKYILKEGKISSLDATIEGTGVIKISADVTDANLTSQGAGTMELSSVSGKLTQHTNGSGTIYIKKIKGSLKHKANGKGHIEMMPH